MKISELIELLASKDPEMEIVSRYPTGYSVLDKDDIFEEDLKYIKGSMEFSMSGNPIQCLNYLTTTIYESDKTNSKTYLTFPAGE